MRSNYVEFIVFLIIITSCIIIVSGLNFEGVGSGDQPRKDKTPEDKGKKPRAYQQDAAGSFKKSIKTNVKKERQKGSSSKSTTENTGGTLETKAERDIGDALDNICKELRIRDLINAGSVCRSWHEVASREISNRGIERALLPHTYSREILDKNSTFHVSRILKSKPYVTLLFAGPRFLQRNRGDLDTSLETHIIGSYKKFFPHHLITIGVDVSMMDETVINSCPVDSDPPNGILGLFIPLFKDLQIRVASATCTSTLEISLRAKQITNTLMRDNDMSKKTAIIMFGNSLLGNDVANEVLRSIKSRFRQKSYTLWGGIFDDQLKASNFTTADEMSGQELTLFAVSLTSASLESWSVIIDCRIEKHEFDQQLLSFKNNIQLKRYSVGLACGPRYVEDSKNKSRKNMYLYNNEMMAAIKKFFPDIPFIGVFNFGYHSHFGVNSMSADKNQQLTHPMAISLMILTYDL